MKYIVITLMFLISSCSLKQESVNNLQRCEEGWMYSELGEYNVAEILFYKCIEKGGLDDYYLGKTYRNLGINYKRKGLRYNGHKNGKIHFKESLKYYDKVLAMKRDDSYMDYVNKGNTYSEMGKYKEAIEEYNKAFKVYPNYNEAYYNLGIVYEKIGDLEMAKKQFILAWKYDLRNDRILNRMIVHNIKQEDIDNYII